MHTYTREINIRHSLDSPCPEVSCQKITTHALISVDYVYDTLIFCDSSHLAENKMFNFVLHC